MTGSPKILRNGLPEICPSNLKAVLKHIFREAGPEVLTYRSRKSVFYFKGLYYIVNCKFSVSHTLDKRINKRTIINCRPAFFSYSSDNFIQYVSTCFAIFIFTLCSTRFAFHDNTPKFFRLVKSSFSIFTSTSFSKGC